MATIRITSGWKITGTKSFRLSSTKFLGRYGTNLQNTDKALLGCLVSRPGYVFVQADQAGAEALVVANEAPRGRFIELFECGIKPHTYMALMIFMELFRGQHPKERYWLRTGGELKTLPEWPDLNKRIASSDREYALGKLVIHAKNYDMQWRTFQTNVLVRSEGTIVLTAAEAKLFLELHGETFPEIRYWQEEIKQRVLMTRKLHNLFGHPRVFNGRLDDETIRDAYSWIAQSTVGEITNIACCELYETIEAQNLDWAFKNNKHDSLVAEVPESEAKDAAKLVSGLLCKELRSTAGHTYRMKAEVGIGRNLGKWHETKNPDGIKELKL